MSPATHTLYDEPDPAMPKCTEWVFKIDLMGRERQPRYSLATRRAPVGMPLGNLSNAAIAAGFRGVVVGVREILDELERGKIDEQGVRDATMLAVRAQVLLAELTKRAEAHRGVTVSVSYLHEAATSAPAVGQAQDGGSSYEKSLAGGEA